MLKKQEEMMADMLKQDSVLEAQDIVLAEQTEILKAEMQHIETSKPKSGNP